MNSDGSVAFAHGRATLRLENALCNWILMHLSVFKAS